MGAAKGKANRPFGIEKEFYGTDGELPSGTGWMSVMAAPHDPGFRQRGPPKDLGIADSCPRNAMAQADADENGGRQTTDQRERKELAELRRRNRVLQQENEILRRTAAYIAQQ